MPRTGSSSLAKAFAVFRKEAAIERRTRHGLASALLFGFGAVLVHGLSSFGVSPPAQTVAATLVSLLVLTSVVALPRAFLVEEDQGTMSLLRLHADPWAAVIGKAWYVCVQALVGAAVLTPVYVAISGAKVADPVLLGAGAALAAIGCSLGVSLCGALALGAQGRTMVAAGIALPMLFPVALLAFPAVHAGLGGVPSAQGWRAVLGLAGWEIAVGALYPLLASSVWRLAQVETPPRR
ncbi:MAG: hypothetical protein AB7F50_07775 [Fimbriimonadaceae bacterium]